MVRYTVAVCNYNMASTVGDSLRSMLEQTTDRYEVVCVDGGSTDGSREVLRELAAEYDRLRIDLRDPDPNRHLGADRNRSFELADGTYVLESLDCDNRYFDVIPDFVSIYHQLEPHVDGEFFLSGMGINMAPRSLLLEVPYRNLGGAEDRDLFRRLAARDAILFISRCGPHAEQLGYFKSLPDQLNRDIHGKICDFQVGITLWSAIKWSLTHERFYIFEKKRGALLQFFKKFYDIFSHLYAYRKAQSREHYETPPPFAKKGMLERHIARNRIPVPELADRLGFEFEADVLSETGKSVFCAN